MERETQTVNVGTQTNRLPVGAVIIQKQEEKKKNKQVQKKQIKSVPNTVPSQEQQFRIFKEIDYPYLMRNVKVQNEEDKMIKALREVFGITEKTPEMVADEALEKSVIKGRSYPLYTDEELTLQERRQRQINENIDLRRVASVGGYAGIFDEAEWGGTPLSSIPYVPSSLKKIGEDYSDYLRAYQRELQREKEIEETVKSFGSKKPLEEITREYSGRGRPPETSSKFKESRAGQAKERATLSLEGAKTSAPAPIFSAEDLELLYGISEKATKEENRKGLAGLLNKYAKLPYAREEVKRRMRQRDFDDNLEKMRRERERLDKDIQLSFGLYEASQKAKKEGEMASLLFD